MGNSTINRTVPPNRQPKLADIRLNFNNVANDIESIDDRVSANESDIEDLQNIVNASINKDTLIKNIWEYSTPVTIEDFSLSNNISSWSIPTDGSIIYDDTNKGLRIIGNGVLGSTLSTTKTLTNSLDTTKVSRVSVKFKSNTPGLNSSLFVQFGNASNSWSGLIAGGNELSVSSNDRDDWIWTTFDTTEDLLFAALGTITQIRFISNNQMAPYISDMTISKVSINDNNKATFGFTYNEAHNTIATIAKAQLDLVNIKGTVFIPTSGASGLAVNDRLTNTQIENLVSSKWGINISATSNNTPLTGKASLSAAISEYLKSQYEANVNYSLLAEQTRYISYPEGNAWVVGNITQIAAATSNGSNIINLDTPSTVVNGSRYYGSNVPDGTIVTTGGVNVSTITLSKSIPAQTKAAAIVDLTSQFSISGITDGLKKLGVKAGRLEQGGSNKIIEGFLRPLEIKGLSLTGMSLNQATVILTRYMKTGNATPLIIPRIEEDPNGWTADTLNTSNTIYRSFHQGIVNLISGWITDNKALAMPFHDMVDRFTPDAAANVSAVQQVINQAPAEVTSRVPVPVTQNFTLLQEHYGVLFDVQSAVTITVPAGLVGFSADFIPPDTGLITFVPTGGTTINLTTTNHTRGNANNVVTLVPRSSSNVYKLTGV